MVKINWFFLERSNGSVLCQVAKDCYFTTTKLHTLKILYVCLSWWPVWKIAKLERWQLCCPPSCSTGFGPNFRFGNRRCHARVTGNCQNTQQTLFAGGGGGRLCSWPQTSAINIIRSTRGESRWITERTKEGIVMPRKIIGVGAMNTNGTLSSLRVQCRALQLQKAAVSPMSNLQMASWVLLDSPDNCDGCN